MPKLNIIIAFVALILAASCSENMNEDINVLPFASITFTQNCGWCQYGESILISQNQKVEYLRAFPCTPENNIKKERLLTTEELQSIHKAFDLETLLSIDLDHCGACYDGCDDTFIIKGLSSENHEFRYDQMDQYVELNKIEALLEILLTIRGSF
jgi:hypothetical protein